MSHFETKYGNCPKAPQAFLLKIIAFFGIIKQIKESSSFLSGESEGNLLADSTITKQALAAALKELMAEIPFEKINVAHICEKCNMNRKSFYYHFKDKYDLVNWIFDIEFISVVTQKGYGDRWELFEILADYFYQNRVFYRKALKIKGQNSFSEHFQECLRPVLQVQLEKLTGNDKMEKFMLDLLADICICAFTRWLSEKDCFPPKQFVAIIQTIAENIASLPYNETEKKSSRRR